MTNANPPTNLQLFANNYYTPEVHIDKEGTVMVSNQVNVVPNIEGKLGSN